MIGEVVERKGVRLAGLYGVKRTLDLPHAEPLPRIRKRPLAVSVGRISALRRHPALTLTYRLMALCLSGLRIA